MTNTEKTAGALRNDITEMVFILDRSGSMAGLESDTIGGFNGMLRDQKKKEGRALVTTVLFNHASFTLHDRLPIEEVEEMTDRDYQVGGCTALIDALGETIDHIRKIRKYIRPEDVPAKTVFVITTDGLENASHTYTSGQVKSTITELQSQGWEFLFLGANIDAVQTAAQYGIRKENAVDYHADSTGTGVVYESVSNAIECFRASASPCMAPNWSAKVKKDFKSRKKNL